MQVNSFLWEAVKFDYAIEKPNSITTDFWNKSEVNVTDDNYLVSIRLRIRFENQSLFAQCFYVVYFKDLNASINDFITELTYQSFSRASEYINIKFNHTIKQIPTLYELYKGLEGREWTTDMKML